MNRHVERHAPPFGPLHVLTMCGPMHIRLPSDGANPRPHHGELFAGSHSIFGRRAPLGTIECSSYEGPHREAAGVCTVARLTSGGTPLVDACPLVPPDSPVIIARVV
jgi:hypothetical protein